MGRMSKKWYREQAMIRSKDGELEVDENATVSMGDDLGAYVQGWLWVCDPPETAEE
jgi:hypothetical protein